MNEPSHEEEIREEKGAQRSGLAIRKIPTPIRSSKPKQKFNKLIYAITNMMGAITMMQQQFNQHWDFMNVGSC